MKNRFYKISVNIGPLKIASNSKIYSIKEGQNTILPGLKYSILSLIFGWWGFRFYDAITNTLEALHTNFSGGEDVTQFILDKEYDDDTNYIWNNLLRSTSDRITKDDFEIMLKIQTEYLNAHPTMIFTSDNTKFLLFTLEKLGMNNFNEETILDIYDAISNFHAFRNS